MQTAFEIQMNYGNIIVNPPEALRLQHLWQTLPLVFSR